MEYVIVIIIEVHAQGISSKKLKELEIRGRIETILTTSFLREARILKRVMEIWWDSLPLTFQWKTTINAGVKNSQEVRWLLQKDIGTGLSNANKTFKSKERKFYQKVGGEWIKTNQQPDTEETKQFWSKIWDQKERNKWINNTRKELRRLKNVSKADIHLDSLRATFKIVIDWKTPSLW